MSGGTTSGPRREQLAELDERRTELVEHLAQVPPRSEPVADIGPDLDPRRPRQQVRELVPLEEIAEAVPDRDLGDLGETADLARAGTRRHVGSVPRGGRYSHRPRYDRGRRPPAPARRRRPGGEHRRRSRRCAHGLARPRGVPRARDAARLGRAGRDRVRRRGARTRGRDGRAGADPLRGRAPDLVAAAARRSRCRRRC